MLSNAYFLAKFRFDTADNEPAKNLQNFRKMQFSSNIGLHRNFRRARQAHGAQGRRSRRFRRRRVGVDGAQPDERRQGRRRQPAHRCVPVARQGVPHHVPGRRGGGRGERPAGRAQLIAKRGSFGQMQISAELVPIPDASGCVRMRPDASGCVGMRRDASGCVGMLRDASGF